MTQKYNLEQIKQKPKSINGNVCFPEILYNEEDLNESQQYQNGTNADGSETDSPTT